MTERDGVRRGGRFAQQVRGQSLAVVTPLVEALVLTDQQYRRVLGKTQAVGPNNTVLELLILRTTRSFASEFV